MRTHWEARLEAGVGCLDSWGYYIQMRKMCCHEETRKRVHRRSRPSSEAIHGGAVVVAVELVAAGVDSMAGPGEGRARSGMTAQKMLVRLGLLKWDLDTHIHHPSLVDRWTPEDDPRWDMGTRHFAVGAVQMGGILLSESA